MDEVVLHERVGNADNVKALVESKGWELVKKSFEEKLKELDSIGDVTTIKQLEGKKFAKRVLVDWWVSIQGYIDDGEFAKEEIEKIKTAKPLYRTARV